MKNSVAASATGGGGPKKRPVAADDDDDSSSDCHPRYPGVGGNGDLVGNGVVGNLKSDDSSQEGEQCYLLNWLPRYFLQASVFPFLRPAELGEALSASRRTAELGGDAWRGRYEDLLEAARRTEAGEGGGEAGDGEAEDSSAAQGGAVAVAAPASSSQAAAVVTAASSSTEAGDAGNFKSAAAWMRLYRKRYYLIKDIFEDPFSGHAARVSSAVPLDEDTFVTASHDGTLRTWRVATGQAIHTFVGHSGKVHSVARIDGLDGDGELGRYFVSGGGDRMGKPCAKLWDSSTMTCLRTFIGHADDIMAVARIGTGSTDPFGDGSSGGKKGGGSCSGNGGGPLFVTASLDASTKIWEARTGRCVGGCFGGGADGLESVATLGRDGLFATADGSRGLSFWRAGQEREVHHFPPPARRRGNRGGGAPVEGAMMPAAIGRRVSRMGVIDCGDGRSVLFSQGRQLQRFDVESGECVETYRINRPVATIVATMVRMDKRLYVYLSQRVQNTIGIWDIDTGQVVHHFVTERPVFSLSRLNEVTYVVGYVNGEVELKKIPEEHIRDISSED